MEQVIRKKVNEMQSFYKTFETKDEAINMAKFFNMQAERTESNKDYTFEVRSFSDKDKKYIAGMNEYLEKDLVNISGEGYYVVGINSNDAVMTGNQKAMSFKSVGIFQNENNDLIFTDLTLNRKTSGKTLEARYGLEDIGRASFVLPHPLSTSPVISTLDDKNKIVNQVLRKNYQGQQKLYNADYRSVATNLVEHVKESYFSANMYGREGNSFSFAYAMSYANRHYTGISGKTTTDLMAMAKIDGTEGMNLGSTGSFTFNKYLIGKKDFFNLFEDDGKIVYHDGKEISKSEYLIRETDKVSDFEFNFSRTGDLEDVRLISYTDGKREEKFLNSSITRDVSSRGRFLELFNDKMSQVNQHGKHFENASSTIASLNNTIDVYQKGDFTREQGVDALLNVIKKSYGADLNHLDELTKDGGVLSRENLGLFLDNGYRFNAYLDVNRQSINTENAVTTMSGGIFDIFGSYNKIGQRNAQSDAKMSKAIINVSGTDFNLSEEAKMWSSDLEEYQYKKISFENGHGRELIEEAQKVLYGSKLSSEYMSQQNYMLYAFHNGAFQDSNIIATDLALENISKFDNKDTMMIPFNAMTSKVTGGEVVDYSKLDSSNAYVEGTIENRMFRTLIGEENYKKHLVSNESLIEDYRSIGKHMEGINNLQSLESRKAYANANNNMLGGVNEFLKKHMLVSDSKARVEIINQEAVNPGQFRHLTGVNHAYISGVEFNEKGVLIKTNGIITNGDSTKAMANEVKFTVQSIMPSIGVVNENGYIPISGMNNEKILSKKRGFTGTLLERSLNTLAFNYMSLGDSDDFGANFDTWKKAMSEQYVVDGVGGKKVNIFDALDIDMTYENGTMRFTNNITNEVLADYNFRTKGIGSSVNMGIHEHIARRVKENFGFSLNDKTGSQFTEKLFTILANAEDGLKETLVGSKGNLSQEQRRNLASIFVKGNLEAINMSQGNAIDTNLGAVKGLRLINNIHIMQETKSRADKEGLSIGRLSTLVLRESGMFELADTLEEKIVHDNKKTMERYLALSGAIEDYSDSSLDGTRANKIFSKNVLDLSDKTLRYNIFGTNTTVNNYMNVSPFGDMIKANYDFDSGALKDMVYGKMVGFSNDFLDVADKLSGKDREKYLSNSLKSIAFSDFAGVFSLDKNDEIGLKKSIINEIKSDLVSSNFVNLPMKLEDPGLIENGIANSRAKMLNNLISNDKLSYGDIIKKIGSDDLSKIEKSELSNILNAFMSSDSAGSRETLEKIMSASEESLGFKTSRGNVRGVFNFLNNYSELARTTAIGEYSSNTNSFHMLEGTKDTFLDSSTQLGANRILRELFEGDIDDSFNSDYNVSRMLLGRFTDYTGKNVFNLNELRKIAKNDSFNFLIDELSADESGVIISKTSLTEVEKLVKLNQDLEEVDAALKITNGDDRLKTVEVFKKKIADVRNVLSDTDTLKKTFPSADQNAIKKIAEVLGDSETVADEIIKSSYYDLNTIKKLSVEDRLSMATGMADEKNLSSVFGVTNGQHERIEKIRKVKEESIELLKNNIADIRKNAVRLPNNVVGLANTENDSLRAYGKMLDTFYNKLENGDIKEMSNLNTEINRISSMIKATKGSNIYNDQMNVMLGERDLIRKLIGESVDYFIEGSVNFDNDLFKQYDSIIASMGKASQSGDLLESFNIIDEEVRLKYQNSSSTLGEDLPVLGLGIKKMQNVTKNGSRIQQLNNRKAQLIEQIIGSTSKVHSDLGDNFFRKGGALEKMATTRFKTSIEFSPKEGTIITDYIMAELDDVLKNGSAKETGEFFSSLRTLYGDAVVDDIYTDYQKAVKSKAKKIEPFKVDLKRRLENLSGVVIGDHKSFINAGLESILGDSTNTVIDYGLLSRNPHQYQGSLRSTRYVALGENDINKSFFARMIGDRNTMEGTQGNLYLIGKRTAIAAHGDYDGDKFQALFMRAKDFSFKGKEEATAFMGRNENMFKLYQLIADYEGNLDASLKKGKLNNVEKEILSLGRKAFGMGEKTYGRTVYNKIENILHTQKMERIRTQTEVLSENVSHAEISFFNLLKSEKTVGVDEFSKVYDKLDDQSKLMFLTNKMTVDDLKDFDKFFDPTMLEDKEFLAKINKIKAVADEKDIALKVLEEFGENFGAKGKIAWNNSTLSESAYSSYTGIARTGTVHYSLTNLRDSAATLWSVETRNLLKENIGTLGNKEMEKTLNGLLDSYGETAKFINPLNTIDELIDKLAISSKISDGSNPYAKMKAFNNVADDLYDDIFNSVYTDKKNIQELINFENIKTVSKYLVNNDAENFDIEKFRSQTGLNDFMDIFGDGFKSKEGAAKFIRDELRPWNTEKVFDFQEFNNKDIAKSLANLYALMGKGILGTAASARNVSAELEDAMVANPYGKMKTAIYKKGQNFFYGMNMIFNRNIDEDGFNLNTRIFNGFRKVLGGAEVEGDIEPKKTNSGNTTEKVKKIKENTTNNVVDDTVEDTTKESNVEKKIKKIKKTTDEIINDVVNPGISENTEPVNVSPRISDQMKLDFAETNVNNVEKQIVDSNNELVTSLEARVASLEKDLEEARRISSAESTRIDEIVSQYEEKLHNLQDGTKTNQDFLAGKIDELQEELKSKEVEIEKLERNHEKALNNINGAHAKNSDFEAERAAREAEKLAREHEKAIKNLNAAQEKNSEFNSKKIADLEAEIETLKTRADGYLRRVNELSQENKTIKGTIDSSSTKSSVIKETVDTFYNNAQALYNKHSKIAIGAGVAAILGVAINMLQRNRPVVDLDIEEEQYEKSQGSIYRNLGSYSINTNIRSIR
ncbi:MAG: hypothetical protein ACRCXX_14215 [Cetobacterium sp.]|uniref:hypothetical protein n=1 Tax=Cetobacterium sp. TaxID=2071632 RepID=UPI003F358E60